MSQKYRIATFVNFDKKEIIGEREKERERYNNIMKIKCRLFEIVVNSNPQVQQS